MENDVLTVGDFCGSTVKCDGVTMYHLSEGICENGYPFAHIPSNKW